MSLIPALWALCTASSAFDPAAENGSLLATVPQDAYSMVHCRDLGALRERAERNDWYRLLGSEDGEPILEALAHEFLLATHTEMDELLSMAAALEGEAVFFDTGSVAGFVAAPPRDPAELVDRMRAWMPAGDPSAQRTLEIAGGSVELFAWPADIGGWSGRAGHVAALLVHPWALGIYSGDDAEAVVAAVQEGVAGLGGEQRARLVSSYLEAGGGRGGGIEFFVDFAPLVADVEEVLKDAVEDVLPDPSSLLGLEKGTSLIGSVDVFPGTRVDCNARLQVPRETLAARLADTFRPLPPTLPGDLPRSVWALWSLNWDLGLFYRRARAAYEEAGYAEGLGAVDGALGMAQGLTDVDPIVDVVNQLAGDFAWYLVAPEGERVDDSADEMEVFLTFGLHVGLRDGDEFLTAFEKLTDVGGLHNVLDLEEIAGADVYFVQEDEVTEGVDGGLAFLPNAMAAAPARRVLEGALRALTDAEGASIDGSLMQAAIDENAGACFFSAVEMTPLRTFLLPDLEGDFELPPLGEGELGRDPFDAQLISTVHRTAEGFDFRLHTR